MAVSGSTIAAVAGVALVGGAAYYAYARGMFTGGVPPSSKAPSSGGTSTGGGGGTGGFGGVIKPEINTNVHQITITGSIMPGSVIAFSPPTITISGSGFTPNGQATILLDSVNTIGTVMADSTGSITTTITWGIFNLTGGTHYIIAQDSATSLLSNSEQLIVTFNTPAVNPQLSIMPSVASLSQDTRLNFSMTSFTPSGTISIQSGSNQVAVGTADSFGNLNVSIPIDAINAKLGGFQQPGSGLGLTAKDVASGDFAPYVIVNIIA